MTPDQIKSAIQLAKETGCASITIDGVIYELSKDPKPKSSFVSDQEAEALLKPLSVLDEISDEEVLYWATPYYDEIIAKREAHKKALESEIKD